MAPPAVKVTNDTAQQPGKDRAASIQPCTVLAAVKAVRSGGQRARVELQPPCEPLSSAFRVCAVERRQRVHGVPPHRAGMRLTQEGGIIRTGVPPAAPSDFRDAVIRSQPV